MTIASQDLGSLEECESGLPGMIGESMAFRSLVGQVEAMLPSPPPVLLLLGETGTGKTLLARAIHERSERAGSPFLLVACACLPPGILEDELFGDREGRRIGLLDLVGHGTLVLEDVDRLLPEVTRRLEERVFGPSLRTPRIIGTTRLRPDDLSPPAEIRPAPPSWMREHHLTLPPLRRRDDDLELLAEQALALWSEDRGVAPPEIDEDVFDALHAHPWPGNVRELRDVMGNAAEIAPGAQIREEHLRIRTRDTRPIATDGDPAPEMILIPSKGKAWQAIEAEAVQATLEITSGNRSQAARILGISRPTLGRKIKKYQIDIPPPL